MRRIGPWDTLGDTLAPFLLQRLKPLSGHTHLALAAIPRSWLRAVSGIGRNTIDLVNAAAAETVAIDAHAQLQCDGLRRRLVAFDLGTVSADRVGLPPSLARALVDAGIGDLDQIMRTPDRVLRAMPGFGPARLRQLRWARVLAPLDSAVETPSPRPLCTDAEWRAAAPLPHPRPHTRAPQHGAGARP